MTRPYSPEFRARAIALVRAGKQVKQTAYDLGISARSLHEWIKQDRIERGERVGVSASEYTELRAARKRIRELESELVALVALAGQVQRGGLARRAMAVSAAAVIAALGLTRTIEFRPWVHPWQAPVQQLTAQTLAQQIPAQASVLADQSVGPYLVKDYSVQMLSPTSEGRARWVVVDLSQDNFSGSACAKRLWVQHQPNVARMGDLALVDQGSPRKATYSASCEERVRGAAG